MLKSNSDLIFEILDKQFPDAKCELEYNNIFELLVAVVLSAQTTDKSVNKVTPLLFSKYPDPLALANADIIDVQTIIKSIGLSSTKAKNIVALAKTLLSDFLGIVPSSLEQLMKLPGVGRKTANVVLSEGYSIPRIAVDTHVLRVANRLLLVDSDNVLTVENQLMDIFCDKNYHRLHLILLFFGRYICKASSPQCQDCPIHNNNIACSKYR